MTVLDFGSYQHVSAMTYVVSNAHKLDHDVPVSEASRKTVLNGAKLWQLTDVYQAKLKGTLQVVSPPTDSELR